MTPECATVTAYEEYKDYGADMTGRGDSGGSGVRDATGATDGPIATQSILIVYLNRLS